MSPEREKDGSAEMGSRQASTRFALGEVALIWMVALVGPMLIACAVAAAVWGAAVGVIIAAVCLAALLVIAASVRRSPERRMEETPPRSTGDGAARAGSKSGDRRRLLIVAEEAAHSAEDVPFAVRALVDTAGEILVVSPVLAGRLDWLASATDRAREQADERLRAVLGQLDESGATAHGAVGDDDPLVALDDAIAQFEPDHLLIALRSAARSGWQRRGLLDEVQQRFAVPMTVFQFPR
jgi:hypothetical protein